MGNDGSWVDSWVTMPQVTEPDNLPPAPFARGDRVFADTTLRQTLRACLGAQRVRLRFSNAFGDAALPITAAFVALPACGRAGVPAVQPGTSRPLAFGGRSSVSIPSGGQAVSDPVDFPVAPGTNVTVTLYLADGQAGMRITSHPGSRTTSYLAAGDHADAGDLPAATAVEHWYFLSALEVCAGPGSAVAVALGDSLTDGRGTTTNGNDRWPDLLFDRLHADPATAGVAVVCQAAGGARMLDEGQGRTALGRVRHDVLAQHGVRWLVVFEGINDIGTAQPTPAAQKHRAGELIDMYEAIAACARTAGIRVYGATLTPFGGNDQYDDPAGVRDAGRRSVNDWIRTSGRFDGVVDFDAAVRDPADPRRLLPAYDVGDHLHLNPAGYRALADAVPARLFLR